jgi:hypothetical protein
VRSEASICGEFGSLQGKKCSRSRRPNFLICQEPSSVKERFGLRVSWGANSSVSNCGDRRVNAWGREEPPPGPARFCLSR